MRGRGLNRIFVLHASPAEAMPCLSKEKSGQRLPKPKNSPHRFSGFSWIHAGVMAECAPLYSFTPHCIPHICFVFDVSRSEKRCWWTCLLFDSKHRLQTAKADAEAPNINESARTPFIDQVPNACCQNMTKPRGRRQHSSDHTPARVDRLQTAKSVLNNNTPPDSVSVDLSRITYQRPQGRLSEARCCSFTDCSILKCP